jgi:hypothetical protein
MRPAARLMTTHENLKHHVGAGFQPARAESWHHWMHFELIGERYTRFLWVDKGFHLNSHFARIAYT